MNFDIMEKEQSGRPLVSIIVPVYNTERYICQCVNSLIYQTLRNIEIILVDDGSKDNCPDICDNYAKMDNRVRVIHQQNGGYGKACNAGFKEAHGEYLGIVESDDYAELNMFECLFTYAKSNNLDVVRCHFYKYYSRTNIHERVNLSYVPQNLVCSPMNEHAVFYQEPSIWSMIYNSEFIRKNNINFLETPGASFQDTSFAFKVYACVKRFMLIEETLINYRFDNTNSSVNSKAKIFCVCDEYKEIIKFARGIDIYNNIKYLIVRLKFSTYLWNYFRLDKKNGLVFLKKFSNEMRMHIKEKEINKELFSTKEFLKIYVIAFFYKLYFIKRLLKLI